MKTTTQQHESLDALSKKGTCIEFFSAYQDMDLDRMLSLCDVNGAIAFEPLGDAFKGKIHEVGKGLWSAIMDSFPNLDNTVKSQVFDEMTNTVYVPGGDLRNTSERICRPAQQRQGL